MTLPQQDSFQKVTDFDFRRKDDLPAADIQDFRAVQESFGGLLAEDLTAYFRKEFLISLKDVRQMPWGQYSGQFTQPACFLRLQSKTLPGSAVLELGQSFVFSVLEILLGGKNDSVVGVSRELTSIEKKLLAGFFRSIERQLRIAWSENWPEFVIESVIGSPAAAGIPLEEPTVATEFVVATDGSEGTMCLVVPARFVRQRRQNPDTPVPLVPDSRQSNSRGPILRQLQKSSVRADITLTNARIRVADLASIEPGDIFNLGYSISSPLSLSINGVAIFDGFVNPVDGKRGFSIQSVRRKGLTAEGDQSKHG